MPQSGSCGEALQIGAHDLVHAAQLAVVPEFIHGDAFGLHGFFQRFQGNVKANFVSELEAIGNRFGHVGQLDLNAIHRVRSYPLCERLATKADNAKRGIGHGGNAIFVAYGDPHFVRGLCRQPME